MSSLPHAGPPMVETAFPRRSVPPRPPTPPKGAPTKRIRTPADIQRFLDSPAHVHLNDFIGAWCESTHLIRRSSVVHAGVSLDARLEEGHSDASQKQLSEGVRCVYNMLVTLRQWVRDIPLSDTHKARFGNQAYRVFHARLTERCAAEFLAPLVQLCPEQPGESRPTEERIEELRGYLLDSFGNATRIDYGTGHELHFVLFLMILQKAGAFGVATPAATRHVVFYAFWGYIEFMRVLQEHYRMEPAGSHGVWGLDDFHHVPFIVGAAQLAAPVPQEEGKAKDAEDVDQRDGVRREPLAEIVPPSTITDGMTVDRLRSDFLYYSMIAWIRENKRGAFHEHSSVLYNVSGLDDWGRICRGMMKMFRGEVVEKFNIVQHLLFGAAFAFPAAMAPPVSPPAQEEGST